MPRWCSTRRHQAALPAREPPEVGHELGGRVEARLLGRLARNGAFEADEVELSDPRVGRISPPDLRRALRIGEERCPVDHEQGLAVDPYVPLVGKHAAEKLDMAAVVVHAVPLLEENFLVLAVPAARPVLVRPAEAEGKVGLAARQHLVEGPLEDAPAAEPVVVIAEPVNQVVGRERRLRGAHLREAQVVEAELPRQMRLVMPREPRPRPDDLLPLGEPWAPPFVVLGDRVELRQVHRDRPDGVTHGETVAEASTSRCQPLMPVSPSTVTSPERRPVRC